MSEGVPHYSALVAELTHDHRQLLAAYGALKHSAEAGDVAAFKSALGDFKALLVPHVVKEAYKVYTYLRQTLRQKGELEVYQRVNAYKSEMGRIGDAAIRFIDTYSDADDETIDFPQVRAALHEIGQLLGDRIRREEADLYPLYKTLH